MPVHDAMYTHSVAQKLQDQISSEKNQDLYEWLEAVMDQAVEASSASAQASLALFEVLNYAKDCSDPAIAELARDLYSGPYNSEIA